MSLSIKIIILGDQYTGKTSLMNKIISNTFYNTYSATIGIDYTNIKYDYDGKIYNLSLWDTSGQEKFNFLLQSYFSSVSGVTPSNNSASKFSLQLSRQVCAYSSDFVCPLTCIM